MRKGQGQKPLLNAREHRANSVRRCLNKCNFKLYYAKRKAFITFAQKRCQVLWARSHLRRTEGRKDSGNLNQTSPHFRLFYRKTGHRILRAKMKDYLDCYKQKVKNPATVMVWGCISAHGMGDLHICDGIVDVDAYFDILV